jgi:hypothetical protein
MENDRTMHVKDFEKLMAEQLEILAPSLMLDSFDIPANKLSRPDRFRRWLAGKIWPYEQ